MAKLTRRLISQSRVIAKGKRIRDIPTLGRDVWWSEIKVGQEEQPAL